MDQLGEIDWEAVQTNRWQRCKERKQAEFLLENSFPWHLVETVGGIAASAGENWEVAETHFETAMRQAEEFPFETEKAEIRRWQAEMLIRRAGSGDHEKAGVLLEEAAEAYRGFGFPKFVELAEEMLAKLSQE